MSYSKTTESNLNAFARALRGNNNNNNNISNENLINVKTVNTSGPEWKIPIGNVNNNIIPNNLKYTRSKGGKRKLSYRKKKRVTNRRRTSSK